MKKKFMNSVLAFGAIAMLSLFGSCSSDESGSEAVAGKTKTLKVRISIPSTYGVDDAVQSGDAPSLEGDVYLFFVGGGYVRAVKQSSVSILTTAGEVITDVPEAASSVVIVGNSATATIEGLSGIQAGDLESKVMFVVANQGAFSSNAVNMYGRASIAGFDGEMEVDVTVLPAVSRIEIGEVKSASAGDGVTELTGFKLAGIYINNTYAKFGMNYEFLPPPAPDFLTDADKLNYVKGATVWESGYPAAFCDIFPSPAEATTFTPATFDVGDAGKVWSYYVLPVKAGNGTTINIDGEEVQQSSVPHIVLKIVDAKAGGAFALGTYYVTVTQLEVGGEIITELERGKVYQIEEIEIAGENLSLMPEPGENSATGLTVRATVEGWTPVATSPKIPK
ncbi:MAG: hypothetical protein LBR26_02840 [Prevotella sp.]|jgi:hypothetical protein|nr:hypothetical protein [Prevotella sp.]